jgi:hypothetical protein
MQMLVLPPTTTCSNIPKLFPSEDNEDSDETSRREEAVDGRAASTRESYVEESGDIGIVSKECGNNGVSDDFLTFNKSPLRWTPPPNEGVRRSTKAFKGLPLEAGGNLLTELSRVLGVHTR